jgi:hypothetical protein
VCSWWVIKLECCSFVGSHCLEVICTSGREFSLGIVSLWFSMASLSLPRIVVSMLFVGGAGKKAHDAL